MKISVTSRHIKEALCGNPYHCMIAEAIRDSLPHVRYVSVRTNGITITQHGKNGSSIRSHWTVPTNAARAIIRFDNGEDVRPFYFKPKKVDEQELPPRTKMQQDYDRERLRKRRADMKARGRAEVWRQRISGV